MHSLGLILIKCTLDPPVAAFVLLLRCMRKRGRRPQDPPGYLSLLRSSVPLLGAVIYFPSIIIRYDKDSLSGVWEDYLSGCQTLNSEPTPKDLSYFTWSVLCWLVRFVTSVR